MLSTGELVFGRAKSADVLLDWDLSTSSKHFKIEKNGEHFVLHDLGSTNGTFVNGMSVTSSQLNHLDKILAGSTLFEVNVAGLSDSSTGSNSNFDPFSMVKAAPKKRAPIPDSELLEKPRGTVSPDVILRQVRLRIASSHEKGTVYWLGPGQTLVFGRTDKSDCCLAFDRNLSSRHFSVTCHLGHCEIEDLESRTGSVLNDRNITKERLFNGDRLRVGSTEFLIEVEGVDGPVVRSGVYVQVAAPPSAAVQKFEATKSKCASGLTRIRGKLPDPEAVISIFEALQQQSTLYVLIDFARISLPLPEGIEIDSCILFKWLPPVAASKTPLLFALDELPDWKAYVEEAWGSDAMIAIQSQLPKDELLSNLQQRLTESSHGPEAAQGIVGFCWPSVLESLLENNQHGFVERFFDGLSLVFFEVPGDAESWQVFGMEESIKFSTSIALRVSEAEPPIASP